MSQLHDRWLLDQKLAFSAACLTGTSLGAVDSRDAATLERASVVIATNALERNLGFLADSTLTLLTRIPADFEDPDPEAFPQASPLCHVLANVRAETIRRNDRSQRISTVLIAHAVYLLKQPHLSIRDFLKWLRRCNEPTARGLKALLKKLEDGEQLGDLCTKINRLLDLSRDALEQTRDRIDAVDELYDALANLVGREQSGLWWLRICLALRSSLSYWPLMVAGVNESRLHGISLPIGLYLSQDGKSKVHFSIVNPKGSKERRRRYVPQQDDVWAHMEHGRLQWDRNWENAFRVGLEVAKEMWRTQNGRLRFVDDQAAQAILKSSLVVDMGAACAIVDGILDQLDGAVYPLSGRSAEAYWVQAVLGMLLPGCQIPLGVVTGRIERAGGTYEIHDVEGIEKKLEYANNAGFSRIILPGIELAKIGLREDGSGEPADRPEVGSEERFDASGRPLLGMVCSDASAIEPEVSSNETTPAERPSVRGAVTKFLQSLADSQSRKSIEINFCENARSAADAMQPSGWRRTSFVRLPETQRHFTTHLHRLFLKEQMEQGRRLSREDQGFSRWTSDEIREMTKLDRWLTSGQRAIKFIDRAEFDRELPQGAEAAIGKWLAWKDHQVRSGALDEEGLRGPGLGILCLRSTETDNEMRLWSAIADVLSASPEWWDCFRWSDRNQAAKLLAQLLGNRRGDPAVSLTSAPDVLLLLDEGDLTQRRTNPIFPDDFRGQWLDLLNPTKDDRYAPHPLNEALLREGLGSLGATRIIVVHGPPDQKPAELPDDLGEDEKEQLERLAVFRFGFSIQAAYAMMNYGQQKDGRLTWIDVDEKLKELMAKKLLYRTRGHFYVPPQFAPGLREGKYSRDAEAHLHAAKSLTPILEPRGLFIASNRDRALEPEPALEATWHLHRARMLLPPRDKKTRPRCSAAVSTLTFLRPFADWDTLKQLQHAPDMYADAVELGRELLNKETAVTNRAPHSSRIAALLNAIGTLGRSLGGENAGGARTQLADEATGLYAESLTSLATSGAHDLRRQKRKLFSEYIYCMKMLKVPDIDARLKEPLNYLDGTMRETIKPNFYEGLGEEYAGLDNYPLARDWSRARWEDVELPRRDRSTNAYVAARLHIGRWRNDELVREPWDQPWVEYFALTTSEDFDARQLSSPLTTWHSVYGEDKVSAQRFGQRVCDFVPYGPGKRTNQFSWWGSKIRAATDNLWTFINHAEPTKRLLPFQANIALNFISVVVMLEAVPTFDFIERRGKEWLAEWPRRLRHGWSSEWNTLSAQIVCSQAGWISMLASLGTVDEHSIGVTQSWLQAHRAVGGGTLQYRDPDGLLTGSAAMELVATYRRKRALAIRMARELLAQRNAGRWVVYGELRKALQAILVEVDGQVERPPSSIASRSHLTSSSRALA